MKHVSILLRSRSWNVLLLLCMTLPLFAQKEYKIDQVSVVNVGDGRLLYRDLTTENPLNDEHRIIDGYHSAYLLVLSKMAFTMAAIKNIWIIFSSRRALTRRDGNRGCSRFTLSLMVN